MGHTPEGLDVGLASKRPLDARHARDQAISLVTSANPGWVDLARATAREIALRNGSVTIDDVRAECPPPLEQDPRIMGAVFSQKSVWERIGYVSSRRRACHARPIPIWKLKNEN